MLSDAGQNKQTLEDNLRFSQWEEEEEEEANEGTSTSNRGKFDME
jgi:hypothetical protein